MFEVGRPIDLDVLPPKDPEFGPRIALVRFPYRLQNLTLPTEPLNALFVGRDHKLHISAAGFSSWVGAHRAKFVGGDEKELCPHGSGIAAFKQLPNLLSVVFVGPNQQLHVAWRHDTSDDFGGPTPMVAPHTPAPWGATIAAGRLPEQRWFVLFVDQQGAINSLRVDGGAPWQGPQRTVENLALPGGGLVAFNQTPRLLTVAFVARSSRHVHVLWREPDDAGWRGPAPIAAGQMPAPPGAAMATAAFPGDDNFLFYVDDAGALTAARVVGYEAWRQPERVSVVGLAPRGAGVAAVAESPDRIVAFVIGRDGALRAFRRERSDASWPQPLQLTVPDFAKSGGAVSAAMQASDLAVVAFEGIDARPYICWAVGGGAWQGPARISWSRMGAPYVQSTGDSQATGTSSFVPRTALVEASRARGDTVRIAQLTGLEWPEEANIPTRNPLRGWGGKGVDLGANTEHAGRLFFFFGDVTLPEGVYLNDNLYADPDQYPPFDGDLTAFTDARFVDGDGFSLSAVTRHGLRPASQVGEISPFHPFAAERIGPLGSGETPTGAFSYAGRCYVFACVGGYGALCYLTSTDRPDAPVGFRMHGTFSKQKFLQVAPWVVKNSEHVGLPSSNGDGVVLVAGGDAAPGDMGVFLAWMPLDPSRGPDLRNLLFYAGRQDDRVRWSPREEHARKVFEPSPPPGYTSVALARLEGPRKWMLMYHLARPNNPSAGIVARFSDDLFGWSNEVSLFDPRVDADATIAAVFAKDSKTSVYGAFPLNRFTQWCPSTGIVTVYYLMSVFLPLYQVHVMRSRVKLKNLSPLTGVGFALAKRFDAIVRK
jgi:hypothetical protein